MGKSNKVLKFPRMTILMQLGFLTWLVISFLQGLCSVFGCPCSAAVSRSALAAGGRQVLMVGWWWWWHWWWGRVGGAAYLGAWAHGLTPEGQFSCRWEMHWPHGAVMSSMEQEVCRSWFPCWALPPWVDTASPEVGGGGGVAVTDNCYIGQWPLCQLIHNTCHHMLSAKRSVMI